MNLIVTRLDIADHSDKNDKLSREKQNPQEESWGFCPTGDEIPMKLRTELIIKVLLCQEKKNPEKFRGYSSREYTVRFVKNRIAENNIESIKKRPHWGLFSNQLLTDFMLLLFELGC